MGHSNESYSVICITIGGSDTSRESYSAICIKYWWVREPWSDLLWTLCCWYLLVNRSHHRPYRNAVLLTSNILLGHCKPFKRVLRRESGSHRQFVGLCAQDLKTEAIFIAWPILRCRMQQHAAVQYNRCWVYWRRAGSGGCSGCSLAPAAILRNDPHNSSHMGVITKCTIHLVYMFLAHVFKKTKGTDINTGLTTVNRFCWIMLTCTG